MACAYPFRWDVHIIGSGLKAAWKLMANVDGIPSSTGMHSERTLGRHHPLRGAISRRGYPSTCPIPFIVLPSRLEKRLRSYSDTQTPLKAEEGLSGGLQPTIPSSPSETTFWEHPARSQDGTIHSNRLERST